MAKKKWLRFRHRVIRNIAYIVLYPYARIKYGITIEKFRQQNGRPYLILLNHQTPFDQFFVGMAFKGPVYYMATEDIFSLGWISKVIRWLVAPIPIKKQTTDAAAVMTCIRVAREGGTIAIAPEGNRTYSGRTLYMNPAIAGLAKKMKLPIALFRLEGGYGVEPRWSDKTRKGRMRGYVSEVIEPEEYAGMTNDQLIDKIRAGLFVDEAKADGLYKSGHRAEYIERAIYVCPECGLSQFESHGNEFTCKKCGKITLYGEDKTLSGVNWDCPFPFVAQWYDYQEDYVNQLDLLSQVDTPLYEDRAALRKVLVYKKKELLNEDAVLKLYGDRVIVDALVLPFEEVGAIAVLGRNKLNIYHGDQVYQIKGDKRFNALKYVHIYHRYKNITRGEADVKFLGL